MRLRPFILCFNRTAISIQKIDLKSSKSYLKSLTQISSKSYCDKHSENPFLISSFNFSHKRPTFAFTAEIEYTPGFAQRITHNGLHAETGAFLPPATARSCAASEIPFIPPCLYIHTFPGSLCPPTIKQRGKIKQNCRINFIPQPFLIPLFNFHHKRPSFAFAGESGYTLGFQRKIAHSGPHAETGGISDGVVSLPSERSARSQTSPGRVSERRTLPLLGLGRGCSQRTQKASGQRCA